MTQTNPARDRDGKDEGDELLRRIDEQTADGQAGLEEPADTMEKRLRLLVPGHAMFRSLEDDPPAKVINLLTKGSLGDISMFEVKWTLPDAEWSLIFVDDGQVTGGIVCKGANGEGGAWRLHEVTRDRFIDVLCALGAITAKV